MVGDRVVNIHDGESANIASDLAWRARTIPDRIGVTFEDGRSMTFQNWDERAQKFARVLADSGMRPNDRVALCLQNSLELLVALFGCWRLGAVPVTLSVMYNSEELASALKKTNSRALVIHGSKLELAEAASSSADSSAWAECVFAAPETTGQVFTTHAEGLYVADFSERIQDALPEDSMYRPGDDDVGTILFTGGTTGMPKAVAVTHVGTRRSLGTLAKVSKKGESGPYAPVPENVSPNLIVLPLFHSGGQQALLFALYVGRSIVLMERFRVSALASLVSQHQVDNLFLMPTMLFDIVHSDERMNLDSVRSVLVSGQTLDPTLKQEFESKFHLPILSNYGSTETGHVAGWTSLDLKLGRWKPGPVGRVYEGVQVEIRDEALQPVAPGQVGEIWVRNGTARGYVEGENTQSDLLVVEGWVASGDMGFVEGDEYLHLVGRKRDIIKTGGFQVWPQEIEQVMRRHEAVADLAVVGGSDVRLGEIPVAFVVPKDDVIAGSELAEQLISYCRISLAHYKCIRRVEFVQELPRSEAGKVSRAELAKLVGGEMNLQHFRKENV